MRNRLFLDTQPGEALVELCHLAAGVDSDVFFNDKPSITADPIAAANVYAVWDRLTSMNTGPTYLARSLDRGATWQTPQPIYDPGVNKQTISNVVVVLPNGALVNLFDGCAISLPAHREGEVPVGLMLAASGGSDRRIFELAAGMEAAIRV